MYILTWLISMILLVLFVTAVSMPLWACFVVGFGWGWVTTEIANEIG